ncbi:MAG: tyrosine-protein phosphatase [Bacilli bacterium]|nr:tyrosine-protein phosphatase [Bacilli bacterium]
MKRIFHHLPIRNFRDLGGYECRYGTTNYGVIYRGGQLSHLSQADLDAFAKMGIKTIIDLRDAKTSQNDPDKTVGDPRFVNINVPVAGGGRIPTNAEDMFESYFEMIGDKDKSSAVIRAIINAEKPCYVHCAIGKDRTGVYSFLTLLANGVSIQDANADYMMSYAYIDDLAESVYSGQVQYPFDIIEPRILFMVNFMREFLKRYGGLAEYLEMIGLSQDEINLFANLLGKQEKSCGAVVMHGDKYLIEHMRAGHWSIPKGHVEPSDEDDFDTARREIIEETKLNPTFIPGFSCAINYSPKEGSAKRVVFFMAEVDSEDAVPQEAEVQEVLFVSFEEALSLLTHESDKNVLKAAKSYRR